MISQGELILYFALVFGIIVLPGMAMAFVLGNALVGGLRAGMGAVVGIMVGGLCHMTLGAAGVALVLRAVPTLFTMMMWAGALYIAWMGWSMWRASSDALLPAPSQPTRRIATPASAFRGAIATSLLNPKAYLFTLAVLPQFVHPERDSIWLQVVSLTLVTCATQAAVYGAIALGAARGRGWLDAHPRASAKAARVVGAGLILLAAITAAEGWHATSEASSIGWTGR